MSDLIFMKLLWNYLVHITEMLGTLWFWVYDPINLIFHSNIEVLKRVMECVIIILLNILYYCASSYIFDYKIVCTIINY